MEEKIAMLVLKALTTVEHNGVRFGPGHDAGAVFEVTAAQSVALLQVKAAELYDPAAAVPAAGVAEAFARADAFAQDIEKARALLVQEGVQAEAQALDIATARIQLEADIKAFEEAKAAGAAAPAAAEPAAAKAAKK